MAVSVQMPALGESVTEGTVTRWLKQEGDTVEEDEPLLEVSTDKVDTEIPSPVAGVLKKIVAQEDDTVEVGGELAVIGDAGEDGEAAGGQAPAAEAPSGGRTGGREARRRTGQARRPSRQPAAPAPSSGGGQSTSLKMPELGESVTEGTVTRWLKKVGDSVEVDEPVVEVSTDKVDTEIPSPVAGTLLSSPPRRTTRSPSAVSWPRSGSRRRGRRKRAGARAQTGRGAGARRGAGAGGQGQACSPRRSREQPAPKPEPTPQPVAAAEPAAERQAGDGGPYVTPLVRKLAAENNIDLATLSGTGVGGRIRKQDVLAAAEAKKAPAAPAAEPAAAGPATPAAAAEPAAALAHLRGTTQKASRIRQLTAKKTRESLQATAQLTQTHEVDMTKIVGLRARAKNKFAEREGVNLTYLPFIARAVIDALKIHPNVNASYNEESKEITYYDAEHLGFAVDTDQGLLSPVIHNAGDLSLAGLARAIADIAARARSGDLKPDELSGGTFTITNIGSQGALFDTPILVPPQAAMLGTGAIVKRPRVIVDESGNESIGVRSVCYLPLTYDHRLIDGADAGRFLTTIKRRLEEGAFEADLGL